MIFYGIFFLFYTPPFLTEVTHTIGVLELRYVFLRIITPKEQLILVFGGRVPGQIHH